MIYNPPLDTPVKVVELINQLSQILENRLVYQASLNGYSYLTIGVHGSIWVCNRKPRLDALWWRFKPRTVSKKLELTLPPKLIEKINVNNVKYLLFELGAKNEYL